MIKQESLINQCSRKMDLYNRMMQMQKENQKKKQNWKRYYNYKSDSSNYEDNENMTDYVDKRPQKKSTRKITQKKC